MFVFQHRHIGAEGGVLAVLGVFFGFGTNPREGKPLGREGNRASTALSVSSRAGDE